MNAPTNSPASKAGTSAQSRSPATAKPIVTAGLMSPPLYVAAKTPIITAIAHPVVMTIQPPFSALDRWRSTAATTPSPKRISIPVPTISDTKLLSMPSPPQAPRRHRISSQLRSVG